MVIGRRQPVNILAYCCIGILLSCTRAEITYLDPQGIVQIYPKEYAPGYALSDSVEYYFYNTDGRLVETHMSDGQGRFEGVLPVGVYRVIATNMGASHVKFTGEGNYDTFIVAASDSEPNSRGFISRASDYTKLLQPDSVYSIVIKDGLIVTENDTIRNTPPSTLLTQQLNLEFTMEDGLEAEDVESMTGVLRGIYPAVLLSTGEGRQLEDSPRRAHSFETVLEGNRRKAHILLFGVRNPTDGEGYENVLELTLTMSDRATFYAMVNISELLSDALESEENISQLSLPIKIKKTPLGVTAEVEEWIEEGESEEDA
jgi:hypothetical protein